MTIKLFVAFIISFIVAGVFGKFYVPWLHKQKFGQEIYDLGPKWHMHKAGTPTMGGVMFILGTLVVCLTVGFFSMLKGHYAHLAVFVFAAVFGGIGVIDDWNKIKNKQNKGLSAKSKFLLQLIASVIFIYIMIKAGFIKSSLYIPFANKTVSIPPVLYYFFAAFVIVGTVNAVNLTDGVDGLASGSSLPVFLFYSVLAFYWGNAYLELGLFASAMLGGLLGFLIYNFNPAKVFMGDTGSLFLGGAIAGLAFAYDMPLILITLGIIFIIETLSDIIQVGYFKLSHGKRVFRMAPFHHHLEMGGWTGKKWKEKELFVLFTGVSLLFAVISFIGIYHRF